MSHIPRFAAYAAAFESAFENDDWSVLEEFFAEDAVYEVGLPILGTERCEGRTAILAWFPAVLDSFDRHFATRELTLIEGPREEGDEVWIRGTATYTGDGVPDFVLELEETVRFDGDRIVLLEDRYAPEMAAATEAYLRQYGAKLGISVPQLPA